MSDWARGGGISRIWGDEPVVVDTRRSGGATGAVCGPTEPLPGGCPTREWSGSRRLPAQHRPAHSSAEAGSEAALATGWRTTPTNRIHCDPSVGWLLGRSRSEPGTRSLEGVASPEDPFPGFGLVNEVLTEVKVEGHRLDLQLRRGADRIWVEVKSGGRAVDAVGLLSKTPSARGVGHLHALARLAESGEQAAAAFVIQRGDVRRLEVGGDADRGWVDAVRSAREAGVAIAAFGCDVTATSVRIVRVLPVIWE